MISIERRTGITGVSKRRIRHDRYGWRLAVAGAMLVLMMLAAATAPAQDIEHGRIDRVGKNGMVIDDMWIRFDPAVIFFKNAKRDTFADLREFTVGKKVGYQLNDEGLLTAIWFE